MLKVFCTQLWICTICDGLVNATITTIETYEPISALHVWQETKKKSGKIAHWQPK